MALLSPLLPVLFPDAVKWSIVWTPSGGAAQPAAVGVFFDSYSDPFDVESTSPAVVGVASDFLSGSSEIQQDDLIDVYAVDAAGALSLHGNYAAAGVEPFGFGLVYVRLTTS